MKNIGGELCLKDEDSKIFFTDSGRSSLFFSIYSLSDIKRVIKNIVLFKIDYV